jgi:hypothetical protein
MEIAEFLAITADCNKPNIHATPSGHPVSFVNTVKTNLASVLGAVASMTADVAIQATIDQNTICESVISLSKRVEDYAQAPSFHLPKNR